MDFCIAIASYYIIVAIYSNMVCSKQTKQTASQVAIATYMQPVKLCIQNHFYTSLDQYSSNS